MSEDALDGPFLLDVMCGKLATMLRFCGYDAAYALDRGIEADDELLEIAQTEDRTLITRDVALADRAGERGLCLTERDTDAQLRELAARGLDLSLESQPSYCGDCNGPVEVVDDDEPTPAYAPSTDEFDIWRCRDCGRYFWKGSHWEDMRTRLASL